MKMTTSPAMMKANMTKLDRVSAAAAHPANRVSRRMVQ